MNLKILMNMKPKQNEIWLANLDPRFGSETRKTRPVLIVQTDSLNKVHPSILICPIKTNIKLESIILRVHLKNGTAKMKEDCDIMIDQLRAIDNKRLISKLGEIPKHFSERVTENIKIILDLSD
jgi:mRNA interferase MazF